MCSNSEIGLQKLTWLPVGIIRFFFSASFHRAIPTLRKLMSLYESDVPTMIKKHAGIANMQKPLSVVTECQLYFLHRGFFSIPPGARDTD
jgi:hypothetical protein